MFIFIFSCLGEGRSPQIMPHGKMILPGCATYGVPTETPPLWAEVGLRGGRGQQRPPQGAMDAKAGVKSLENMLSHFTAQRAVPNHEPLVALHPRAADYELHVVLAWYKYVALGRVPNCQVLAHANQYARR